MTGLVRGTGYPRAGTSTEAALRFVQAAMGHV